MLRLSKHGAGFFNELPRATLAPRGKVRLESATVRLNCHVLSRSQNRPDIQGHAFRSYRVLPRATVARFNASLTYR